VIDSSVSAFIEIFDLALMSKFLTPAIEPKLTNHPVSQGERVLWQERYPKQVLEASSIENYFPLDSMRFSATITFPNCGMTPN